MFDYNGKKWKRKRAYILRRDGYQCQICKRYGRLRQATEVHHIKHADEYSELVYDNGNLISLCHACHNAQHPEKGGRVQDPMRHRNGHMAKYGETGIQQIR